MPNLVISMTEETAQNPGNPDEVKKVPTSRKLPRSFLASTSKRQQIGCVDRPVHGVHADAAAVLAAPMMSSERLTPLAFRGSIRQAESNKCSPSCVVNNAVAKLPYFVLLRYANTETDVIWLLGQILLAKPSVCGFDIEWRVSYKTGKECRFHGFCNLFEGGLNAFSPRGAP